MFPRKKYLCACILIFVLTKFLSFPGRFLQIKYLTFFTKTTYISHIKCFKKPSDVAELKVGVNFPYENYSIFHKCILDAQPEPDTQPRILVVDSICPLGIEVVSLLKQNSIPHIDIRGHNHLNLKRQDAHEILQEFNIKYALIVCDTPQSRGFHKYNYGLPIYSFLPKMHATKTFKIPPVFGHLRGRQSKDPLLNLFYACSTKHFPEFNSANASYALASEVAKYVVEMIESNFTLQKPFFKLYTDNQIYTMFYNHCINNVSNPLVSELLQKAHPIPPGDGKELTLSIVTITSHQVRYRQRLNKTLTMFDYYLSKYPRLPLELILIYPTTSNQSLSHFKDDFPPFPALEPYLRPIEFGYDDYMVLYKEKNCTYFPEYMMRNIGIRRSRGEYILSLSADTFPNKVLFDYVLHHQFTPHTYMRGKKHDIPIDMDTGNVIEIMEKEKYKNRQYFVRGYRKRWDEKVLVMGGGDFQLTHWRAWRNVKGYIDGKEVAHVDTYFSYEMTFSQVNYIFLKIIGETYHWSHKSVSNTSPEFPFYIRNTFRKDAFYGYLSCEKAFPRDDWGHPKTAFLPPIVF